MIGGESWKARGSQLGRDKCREGTTMESGFKEMQ
jgi:hypothetical protein